MKKKKKKKKGNHSNNTRLASLDLLGVCYGINFLSVYINMFTDVYSARVYYECASYTPSMP